MCHKCNSQLKAGNCIKAICSKCANLIDEIELLRFKDETYHAYHFNCHTCNNELTKDAKQKNGELHCTRCYDKMYGGPICNACHTPIDTDQERPITALGKSFHSNHFTCASCNKPFLGSRYYERKGLAYCELDYHHLFGATCFACSKTITGDTCTAFSKSWCKEHFACAFCDSKLSQNDKFNNVDDRPCCKRCFDKLPSELKKRLKNLHDKKK